jgi:hypothetical protein
MHILGEHTMLYKAIIEVDVIVEAQSEQEAIQVARLNAHEEVYDACIHCRPVATLKDVPTDWRDSIPWNGIDDTTVREILARQQINGERKP